MKRPYPLIGACLAAVLVFVIGVFVIGLTVYLYKTPEKTAIDYTDTAYTWNAVFNDANGDALARGTRIDEIKHDIEKLIFAFNRSDKSPETYRKTGDAEPMGPPRLKLLDKQMDTVTVEVINGRYLTQRMGTTGANAFLAAATFTLTEHADINAVNFVFKQGDHAIPGVYSRDMFKRVWNIKYDDHGILQPQRNLTGSKTMSVPDPDPPGLPLALGYKLSQKKDRARWQGVRR